ncbi:MAG TPA: fused MFS/spermidine synthase, partial [Chloroflexia bacterium]|nr:fused MFS/spermidine synthase [Chloroflexia bacterium]
MQIEPAGQQNASLRSPLIGSEAADGSQLEERLGSLTVAATRKPPFLLPIVFVSGMSEMAIQMCASRLIQPFFGSSLLIWANLIGFTMICLTLGYFIGGRLGDRFPRPTILYLLTGAAAITMALTPLISEPVLKVVTDSTKGIESGGLFIGSMAGIIILFTLPMLIAGCVSPFAVRLLLHNVQGAGRTAGTVSSLSTVGSILGTFLPVLWIMPAIGTRATMYLFAAVLLLFSVIGLIVARRDPSFGTAATADANKQPQEIEQKAAETSYEQTEPIQTPFLLPIVFICGMAVMAVEMSASRLIQPYFGDSLLIWACLIGFIIIYLAIGYALGGRLADRFPRPGFLYQLAGLAAFAIGLIPAISNPILTIANEGFKTVNGGLFFGSLMGIVLLFSVPVILLGCVTPFAVRLLMHSVQGAGRTAGKVSAVSTFGSIVGTFLPVLLFIPLVGTRSTLYIFSLVLLAFASVGLLWVNRRRAPVFAAMLVLVLVMAAFVTFKIKSAPYGTLLYEKESAYNYIQVVQRDNSKQVDLVLNEGHAVHSIYNPDTVLTNGPWDYFMVT